MLIPWVIDSGSQPTDVGLELFMAGEPFAAGDAVGGELLMPKVFASTIAVLECEQLVIVELSQPGAGVRGGTDLDRLTMAQVVNDVDANDVEFGIGNIAEFPLAHRAKPA